MIKKTLLLTLIAGLSFTARASVIFSEDFSYPDGALTNGSGGLWTTFSGTGNAIQVLGGTVTGMSASSTSSQDSARNLDATYNSGVLYAGFDLTLSGTPIGSAYFLHFKDATTSGFRGRVFLGAPTSSGFRLGLENDSGDGGATVTFSTDLLLGATYRVVLGYDTGAGTSQLWINNATLGSPDLQDAAAATLLGITSIALRQGGGAANSYSGLNLDNLVVATDFAAAVPEPGTLTLTVVGLGCLLALRRRR